MKNSFSVLNLDFDYSLIFLSVTTGPNSLEMSELSNLATKEPGADELTLKLV